MTIDGRGLYIVGEGVGNVNMVYEFGSWVRFARIVSEQQPEKERDTERDDEGMVVSVLLIEAYSTSIH